MLAESLTRSAKAQKPTYITPLVETLEICTDSNAQGIRTYVSRITHKPDTIQSLKASLDSIGPKTSRSGAYQLGYTLPLHLLRFYKKTSEGWVIDKELIAETIRPLVEIDRPVVVHLAANHFSSADSNELVSELKADSRNLMTLAGAAFPDQSYFTVNVTPWTLADFDARVNVLRIGAMRAVLQQLCDLEPRYKQRIVALSILGETHHMWPDFVVGPAYTGAFNASDFSEASANGFRNWLRNQFHGQLALLNAEAGSSFSSFEEIPLPSRNIQSEALNGYLEHLDSNAAGRLSIYGWVADHTLKPLPVIVYLNGVFQGTTTANLSRSDVLQALPDVRTPNVGFRYQLDYSRLPPGSHNVELFVLSNDAKLVRFDSRVINIVNRQQHGLGQVPAYTDINVDSIAAHPEIVGAVDGPRSSVALFYNPLGRLLFQYREQQVQGFVEKFAEIASASWFPKGMIFSHQMTPQLYGTWNPDIPAVNRSLDKNDRYKLGVTLYGGTAFGSAFFDWLTSSGQAEYGVGELNPLTELSVDEMISMFQRHRAHGARYIAPYFIPIAPIPSRGEYDKFVITPTSTSKASRNFLMALTELMMSY